MTIALLLAVGALVGVVMSAFFSGAETGIYCVNPVRTRVASEQNRPGARRLADLLERTDDLVITCLIGTNLADYITTVCATVLLLRAAVSESQAELYATVILTPTILVFGGVVPKDWFRRRSDHLMLAMARPLIACVRLFSAVGLIWFFRSLSQGLLHRIDSRRAKDATGIMPRVQTLRLLREGAAHGALTQYQRDVMERVMQLSSVRVASVMIPRARAALIPHDIARDDLLRIARMAHFSRLPVFEGHASRVVGILSLFDVLTDEHERPLSEWIRAPLRLPANITVAGALVRLQEARNTMAIVENRANECVGILTVKDLVEEIVGDLEAW